MSSTYTVSLETLRNAFPTESLLVPDPLVSVQESVSMTRSRCYSMDAVIIRGQSEELLGARIPVEEEETSLGNVPREPDQQIRAFQD